jgi:hypothetical protein
MKSLIARLLPRAILVAVIALRSHAQTPGEWHDDLVEHMTGSWKVRGQVMGLGAQPHVPSYPGKHFDGCADLREAL